MNIRRIYWPKLISLLFISIFLGDCQDTGLAGDQDHFIKLYGNRDEQEAVAMVPTPDGGWLIVANSTDPGSNLTQIFYFKVDQSGKVVAENLLTRGGITSAV
ncbi:MAG: hypothetical protein HC880_16965, partial [Bacteroidia bacterium]|nr:hypothetical protein [Bacteroidia bacterium]